LIQQVDDKTKQARYLEQARTRFRQHRDETDPARISALLDEIDSRISFLKIITPRSARSEREPGGVYHYSKDGKLVEGHYPEEKGHRHVGEWDWRDPQAIERHNQLLRRQYFGRDPPKIKEAF
jgi:hypothetical protein